MSRLTVNDLDKVAYNAWELCGMDADCTAYCEGCFVNAIYLKLAHYEDLEEQGLLLKLPCKVGDTVWEIRGVRWKGYDWKFPVYDNASATETKFNLEMLPRIGKKAFLTKEEAEAKLKELQGE